jgi:hypothetical protein
MQGETLEKNHFYQSLDEGSEIEYVIAISGGPKERRMILLSPSNVNKANEILQATQNSTTNMIVAMRKVLVRTVKNKI